MSTSQEKELSQESWFFGDSATGPKRVESPTVRGALDVVIGANCFISGALQLEGRCLIDGTVEGEISASGELVIGETAVVKARITGEMVRVYGRIIGDIDCTKRLELRSGAVVTGNINAYSLTIEDGVSFQGFCTMSQRDASLATSQQSASATASATPSLEVENKKDANSDATVVRLENTESSALNA